jgi:TrmH family RNA methyltransferase
MMNITSGQNPIIKEVKALKNSKGRQEKGLFFVEGTRIFEEAVDSGADVKYVVVSDNFINSPVFSKVSEKFGKHLKIYGLSDKMFNELSDTETPQGILAVITGVRRTVEEITDGRGLYVLLDEIRDPGNTGTIIRTADAAGFAGVIVSKGCVDVYNPKVLRSTMGSVFHIPIYQCGQEGMDTVLRRLKMLGIRVLASHLDGSASIFDADLKEGTLLVIGSEAAGISEASRREADQLVRIPMPGRAESLNASVAAGIMIYEAVRQRIQ